MFGNLWTSIVWNLANYERITGDGNHKMSHSEDLAANHELGCAKEQDKPCDCEGAERSDADRETDTHIMKTALVCLIEARESGNRKAMHGLRRGISVERIREIYQNLPKIDESYLADKLFVEKALKVLREVVPGLNDEIARLKRGEFTPEEFQNLCHNKEVQDGKELFGRSQLGITGKEANILLYAFDYFYGTDGVGQVSSRAIVDLPNLPDSHPSRHFPVDEMQALRNKLFDTHEHPEES